MCDTMERGFHLGADFFDDGSSGSEWEDSEGDLTRTFSGAASIAPKSLVHGINDIDDGAPRGRSRERGSMIALPPFRQPPTQHSRFGLLDENGTTRAREISVRRLSRDSVRLVHNRSNDSTSRGSLGSNTPSTRRPSMEPSSLSTMNATPVRSPVDPKMSERVKRSTSENILAGSIIDAHFHTMRALESLNGSPSGMLTNSNSLTFVPAAVVADISKSSSFTNGRHIVISPLSIKENEHDGNRPADLPSHFIRTPYPFAALKEFPRPKNRPRQHVDADRSCSIDIYRSRRLDSAHGGDNREKECDSRKGKHVLGLATSIGEYDLRSRLERNKEAQGIIESHTEAVPEGCDGIVWLSIHGRAQNRAQYNYKAQKHVKIAVPSSLTIKSLGRKPNDTESVVAVDFDDSFFAERLRDGYRRLTGSWLQRIFSARKLRDIQLGQISIWSGPQVAISGQGVLRLLATGAGMGADPDLKSPFTEEGLMRLYRNPKSGKARYTWVHWARHVAASNIRHQTLQSENCLSLHSSRRRARSLDVGGDEPGPAARSYESSSMFSLSDSITTIQFVRSLSKLRVMAALTLMLALSILAALSWVFLGPTSIGVPMIESSQRNNRVGSGMTLGILVLLFESVGFGTWVWLS
ncbi:hypothetical protein GQ44DRAFT_703186 [Phaeosphaeriaceae sp. PMI808]|nr:hypothetical protein GQ44DRAFT_703186 [Phaeosphaeriaceae sp. PMI808]